MKKLSFIIILLLIVSIAEANPKYRARARACKRLQMEIQHEHSRPAFKDPMRAYRNQRDFNNKPLFYKTGKFIKKTLKR